MHRLSGHGSAPQRHEGSTRRNKPPVRHLSRPTRGPHPRRAPIRRRRASRRKRVATRSVAAFVAAIQHVHMRMSRIALILAAVCVVVLGTGCDSGETLGPSLHCPLPDGGERCSCPGSAVQPFGCAETFTCLDDGTWAPYDASCLTNVATDGATEDAAACAEPQPQPQCSSCMGSPAIVPNCQQGQWVCPPAGPCASPPIDAGDASGVTTGFKGQPCSQYMFCELEGGTWVCDCGGGTAPAYPSGAGTGGACNAGDPSCEVPVTDPAGIPALQDAIRHMHGVQRERRTDLRELSLTGPRGTEKSGTQTKGAVYLAPGTRSRANGTG
jgi:hypothetical protein